MGNSESRYSVQGSQSSSFTFPNTQKLHSSKEYTLSPPGWWRTGSRGSTFKSQTVSRGCLSQPKPNQSSLARRYDYITKGRDAKRRISAQWNGSPGAPVNSHLEENGRDRNGYTVNEYMDRPKEVEDHSSPRVVIKSDGSVRVDFNQISKSSTLPDENGGPVQLLKFSPTSHTTPITGHESVPAPNYPITRTSKRGSLSSEGSWYDSPWGTGPELSDDITASPIKVSETLPSVRIEYFHEQLPSHHLYRDPNMAATFPTAKDLTLANETPLEHRYSFVCVMEEPVIDESSGVMQYSSFTLPCPKPKAVTENPGKKESIRNRMRRLSDWTGSLTRRKRKPKEPRYKEPLECFDSGIDGLTADTSSPSQVSSLQGHPKVQSRARSQSQVLPSCGGSLGALNSGTDALRQNIYDNFMRELETSQTAAGSGEERGDNSAEETESSSQETVGSLEQLDLLCEKEQGVVRRAGWLTFKPLLTLHKDRKLELVARRKWKHYWVTLKGCTLLFYETYGKGCPDQDTAPCYALVAEDGIVQAVPEHPKKENVFCLSNTYGDVYLFQATSQTDLENWVTAIHSASASVFAKRRGKEDTLLLLRGQIRSLLQKIDMDGKMKKMAELQLSVVTDPKNRKAIENQIQQWDENLERFYMDLFRMRCYLSSLQGGELPNPKSLLATASRPSKAALSRLGIFSVSSLHALICSRDEATLRKRSLSLSQRSRIRRGVFSSLKGLDTLTKRSREKTPQASQVFDSAVQQSSFVPVYCTETTVSLADAYSLAPPDGGEWERGMMEKPVCVYMPDCHVVTVCVSRQLSVAEVLDIICKVRNLDPNLHCLRLRNHTADGTEVWTPGPHELLQDMLYDELEVSTLGVYTLHMTKPSCTGDFGFAVTGHVDSLSHSRICVTEVLSDGIAFSEGLRPGDEILVLNGCQVASLDLTLIQTLFSENTLHLTIRREPTAQTHTHLTNSHTHLTNSHTHLTHTRLQPERKSLYQHHRTKSATDVSCLSESSSKAEIETRRHHHQSLRVRQHSKSVETIYTLYHSFQDSSEGLMEVQKQRAGPDSALLSPCPRHMSVSERLRKVVQELVDTEKSYVKDLSCLFEIYLKPLQEETFLTQDEMESLFGSLPEMLDFQKVFLQTLEERIASTPDFSTLESPMQFKKLLFALGGSFLYYADHFKLYSGFCANHIKVQKVLERAKTDGAFKEFLAARNPTKQHSTTLESYLIKPVQRVLKYPLLLRELVSLTDTDSDEHYHLTEALKAMEKVASHINEMQKIYEDYGSVFDQLVAEQSGSEKEVTEISMGEFLLHSSVMWLNPFPSLGRMKKEPELTMFVFKKAVILVYRESSNKLKKKANVPRSTHSHGDQDPFKFRWLIPRSALQVKLGNTADSNCVWELIHTKSELEGRPETLFQLCSSTPESKLNMVKVIRAVLRENMRSKGMRGNEVPPARHCKGHLTHLGANLPSAKLGSSRASWLCQKPINVLSLSQNDTLKSTQLDIDTASDSSGDPPTQSSEASPHNSTLKHASVRESDILSDDDGFSERSARCDSTPSSIETRLHEMRLSSETRVEPEGEETQPQLRRAHFSAVRRRSARSDHRHNQEVANLRQQSHSLDSPSQSTTISVDLNTLLERDFSVHSLTSVINEDCFYDNTTKGSTTFAKS